MAKKILKVFGGDEFDFLLFGIVSQQREYRLCHFLNQRLSLTLQRDKKDYEIMKPKNRQTLGFALFRYEPEDKARFFLFANKTTGGFLIPDLKKMDYFLLIKDYQNQVNAELLLQEIKSIPLVLGAYPLEPEQLRSRENLVF